MNPQEYLQHYLTEPVKDNGSAQLRARADKGNGRAAMLARADEKLNPVMISKLRHGRNGRTGFSLEIALRLQRASGGELDARKLYPQAADLVDYLLARK